MWHLILALSVVYREGVLWTSLLYRQRYVVSLSSNKCTNCKSLWIKVLAKCPQSTCEWLDIWWFILYTCRVTANKPLNVIKQCVRPFLFTLTSTVWPNRQTCRATWSPPTGRACCLRMKPWSWSWTTLEADTRRWSAAFTSPSSPWSVRTREPSTLCTRASDTSRTGYHRPPPRIFMMLRGCWKTIHVWQCRYFKHQFFVLIIMV